MQEPFIRLKEVVWEIVGRCENGCLYCGSKDIRNTEIDESKIINIAKEIAKYPPEKVNISGGDPTLVSVSTHNEVYNILKESGIKEVVVLINPNSYRNVDFNAIINIYDWIGVSVNTENDIEIVTNNRAFIEVASKMTIITNFNTNNIFLYKQIEDLVKKIGCLWQIQFTIDEKDSVKTALYHNNGSVDYLERLVNSSIENGIKIILCDNMNDGPCTAGTKSIGIAYNGDVLPCLSMRSWVKDIEKVSQGNILKTQLNYIWQNYFQDYRFSNFKCCKDICNNKKINIKISKNNEKDIYSKSVQNLIDIIGKMTPGGKIYAPIVTMYGVGQQPIVSMYAVSVQPSTMAYAVSSSGQSWSQNISGELKNEN